MRPQGDSQETPGRVQPYSLLRESVTSGDLHRPEPCFTCRSLSLGVELPEVLDVLGILDGDPVLCLQEREPGVETRAILNGPSHMGESLWSPSLENIHLRRRSPTSSIRGQTLWQWYCCSACWYLAPRSEV